MVRRVRVFSLMSAAALLAGTFGGAPSVMAATQAAPAVSETAFMATAYGSEVDVQGGAVTSGRSALSVLGCISATGVTHTNTVNSVSTPVLGTGTIDTSTASLATDTGVASQGTATTQGASLLGGLVSATTVESVSTTSLDTTTGTLSTDSTGTQFVGLSIAGTPVTETPAPNTEMALPGVGYVILNEQHGYVDKHQAALTVIGIHVVVTQSTALAEVGTNIVVSYAHSALSTGVGGLLDGLAYGAKAYVIGGTVLAGPQFPQPLACLGTGGATKTNMGAGINIVGVLTSGTVTDTAEGVARASSPSAEVTSTVQGLNLGNGMVTATAVEADVTAAGNPPSFGDNSTFLDLDVNGTPVSNPLPNTKEVLPGIGTLWLHKVHQTANSITVIMVQLDVTVPSNPTGLAPGTVVNVASATVSLH